MDFNSSRSDAPEITYFHADGRRPVLTFSERTPLVPEVVIKLDESYSSDTVRIDFLTISSQSARYYPVGAN